MGRLNKQGAVCLLLCRVLSASGIRWRSGGSVTLLVLGRTTGIVESCVYYSFLRRLYSKPVAGGFACGGMEAVRLVRTKSGEVSIWPPSVMICEVSRCAFFIRAILPVSGVMVLYYGLHYASFSPVRDVALIVRRI